MASHLDREEFLLRRLEMGGTALEDLYSKPFPFELDEGLALARDRIMVDCVCVVGHLYCAEPIQQFGVGTKQMNYWIENQFCPTLFGSTVIFWRPIHSVDMPDETVRCRTEKSQQLEISALAKKRD